jgi:predicted metalloprotease with PDZ domain
MLQRLLASLALLAAPAAAQFDYSVSIDRETETWSVEGRFANPGAGDVDFWIARWTAGAYHLADYGRFVQDLVAHDAEGNALAVERLSDSHFRIAAAGAEELVVAYDALAISDALIDDKMVLDVESNRIKEGYAYVTPVSLFGFVPGREGEPYSLRVELPEGWRTATVLEADEDGVYRAPSYWRFEDSPLLFAPDLVTVATEAGGKPLDVTVLGLESEKRDQVVEICRVVVDATATLMGGLPYERYHFLMGYVPEAGGSGLEHSYSTLILLNPQVGPRQSAGIIAHEFFHLFCAERIHVQAIRTPDYTSGFESGTIWVNESITEYMTQHILLQAGLLDQEGFLAAVGPNPGVTRMLEQIGAGSPTDVSRAAGDWEDMQALMRFALKMYQHGPRIVLALDMEMRRHSDGERGVIDLLHHLMDEYVAQDRGFPEDGMEDIVEHVAGGDLTEFFAAYIDGAGNPVLADHLDVIGFGVEEGRIVPLPDPTEAQLAARADFFSIDG